MSADEIKALADKMVQNAFWFDESNEMERMEECYQAKDALLSYAAMVERCESEIALTDKTHYTYNRLNYILRGDAEKEAR